MVFNHPVEWWQLGGVALICFGALRWYIPAMVDYKVCCRMGEERARQRAEIEQAKQTIALARVGRFQATNPPPEVHSGQ